MEPLTNVGLVCSSHAPKVDPKYAKMKPESFIGKFVKTAFDGKRPGSNKEMQEHMWVLVKKVEDGKLIGELNNDPICDMKLKCGDMVSVSLSDIEAVTD